MDSEAASRQDLSRETDHIRLVPTLLRIDAFHALLVGTLLAGGTTLGVAATVGHGFFSDKIIIFRNDL